MTTKSERGHTPTPWEVVAEGTGFPGIDGADHTSVVIYGIRDDAMADRDDGGIRGNSDEQALANAAFIVRAVNSHEALVEALSEARAYVECDMHSPHATSVSRKVAKNKLDRIDAALSLATDKETK